MGRSPLILQSELPYNITIRCINREWFNLPMDDVWKVFCEHLNDTVEKHQLLVHQFVLMSSHYHMVASTPEANVDKCLHRFHGQTSRHLNKLGNRINETFAGRNFKAILPNHASFLNAYKYNYRNPVAAGICEKVEEYPFSTLQVQLGNMKAPFQLAADASWIASPAGTLSWLNTPSSKEKVEALKWGLKRQIFKSKKNRNTGKLIIGDDEII